MQEVLRRLASAHSGLLIGAALSSSAGLAWWALLAQQASMSTHPMNQMWMLPTGTWNWSFNDFALTWSMWAIMMVAMMLPVATPMALLIGRMGRNRPTASERISLPAFFLGYFLVWLGFSLAATLLQWLLHGLRWLTPMMEADNAVFAGALLVFAGLYQFTPWKSACLNHCRTPIGFLLDHWLPGWFGALRLGWHHGRYCLGCCWAEMLVMFAVGVMNVVWMGGITLAAIAERYLPRMANSVPALAGIGLIGFGVAHWL